MMQLVKTQKTCKHTKSMNKVQKVHTDNAYHSQV